VALVDDHAAVRAAFRTILEAHDLEVVGEASDGDGAVSLVRSTRPDVVLMDVRMPGRDGISAARAIVSAPHPPRVLVLTTFDDDEVLWGALGSGASGFMLKNSPPEDLVAAIRRVATGDSVLDPTVAGRVFARFAATGPPDPEVVARFERLTGRERDVLELVAAGMSNAEIATALGVGEATAKTHLSRMLTKLEVRDRVQAVILAYRHHQVRR
jgi:DNA-binding NarL/FixJ family response regulator